MTVRQFDTGVPGLDAILHGGYLGGAPTLLMGQPGCGKTLFLLQFLATGAARGERAVCATCSEAPERLTAYMTALGHPAERWIADGTLVFVDLRPVPGEVVTGSLDQEVVKLRLDAALAVEGTIPDTARLGIDDLNRLAYAFDADGIARDTTQALLRALRESGITTLITAAEGRATRDTLVDYAVDAVIELRQMVESRLMTRTLRVTKMRGVGHGTNEYPFLIDERGPSLMPVTQLDGHYRSREGMVSTGVERLDDLLGGGLYKGSSLMLTGTSGTGKTTLSGQISAGLCASGLKVLYATFEQDESELDHDLGKVGIDLRRHLDSGALTIQRVRSVDYGLEEHLIRTLRMIDDMQPDVLVVDAITALSDLGPLPAVKGMILRLLDACKARGVMVLMTELLGDAQDTVSVLGLSSLLDAWIRLELYRQNSEFVRLIRVLKGRGARTSQQIKEFRITETGLQIEDPYVGGGRFVFGTEKMIQEQKDRQAAAEQVQRLERLKRELAALPDAHESQLAQIRLDQDRAEADLKAQIAALEATESQTDVDRLAVRNARGGVE
jgi:circadian clock protein KaiC